jgi:hypothetical protein
LFDITWYSFIESKSLINWFPLFWKKKMAATVSEEHEAEPLQNNNVVESCSHLPDDIWESIFNFFDGDNGILNSLSVVSKQFLSITDRLRLSVK